MIAVDDDDYESVFSDEMKAAVNDFDVEKRTADNVDITQTPDEYKLLKNYPNPFNPATLIRYSIKESGLVSVKVFDVLGNEVAVLVNEVKPAGIYEAEFNRTDLPSGVYIYSLRVNDFVSIQKMVLLK